MESPADANPQPSLGVPSSQEVGSKRRLTRPSSARAWVHFKERMTRLLAIIMAKHICML